MRIHAVRHAESEANVIGGLHCSIPGPGLSQHGVTQAQALGQALLAGDRPITAVYASAMTRSHQTAAAVAAAVGVDVVVLPGLHETHLGDLDGRVDDEAHRLFDELFTAWMLDGDLDARRPGGESGTEIVTRMRTSLDTVLDRRSEHGDAVLVSHGAALRLWLSHPGPDDVGVPAAFALRHHLGNTDRVVLDVGTNPRLRVVRWAGVDLGDQGMAGDHRV